MQDLGFRQGRPPAPATPPRKTNAFLLNALSLGGIQGANGFLPLIVMPFLARKVGPSGLGTIVLAQTFGVCVNLAVEFGFGLSATREIARNKASRQVLSATLGDILSAKLLLALLTLIASSFLILGVRSYRAHSFTLFTGVLWGTVQGFNLIWFYQGLEELIQLALIDLPCRLLSLAAIILCIHGAGDEPKVLAILGSGSLASVLISTYSVWRRMPNMRVSVGGAARALRLGWYVFVFRASNLLSLSSVMVLALFVSPNVVAFYAGAEKLARLPQAVLAALGQLTYPKIAAAAHRSLGEAAPLAVRTWIAMVSIGCVAGAAEMAGARIIVRTFLGKGYEAAVPYVTILAVLCVTGAIIQSFGAQWMLPLGLDKSLTRIVLSAGLLNVAAGALGSWRYGAWGMIFAVIGSDVAIALALGLTLWRRGLLPAQPLARRGQEYARD